MDYTPHSSIEILNSYTQLFIDMGQSHKYLNFFIGMFLESIGIPFAAMPAFASTGYLLANGEFNFWWAVVVGGLGNALGSTVSYGIGYFFGDVVRKFRKDHKIAKREDKLQDYIKKYGTKTIFFSQLFGFTRVFVSIPAGLLKMNFWKFFIATFTGGMIFVIYFALGSMYAIEAYEKYVFPYVGLSFISLGVIIGVAYIITHTSIKLGKHARRKIKEKNGQDN